MTLTRVEKQLQAEQQLPEQQLQEFERYLAWPEETREANPRLAAPEQATSKRHQRP